MNEASPLYHALIGGITGGFIGIIMAIPAIIRYFKKRRYENDLSAFHQNADGGYTCPVCGMTNDRMDRCERCYYIPPALRNVEARPRSSTPPAVPARVKDTPPPAPAAPTQEPPAVQEPIAVPASVAPADESSALYFAIKDGAIGTFARRLTLFYTAVRQHPSCKGCTVEQILSVSTYLNMLPHLSENAAIGDICAAVRSVKLAESGCIRASGVERKHSASPAYETELIGYAAMQGIAVANCLDGTRSPEENVNAAIYFKSAIADIVKETFEQKSTTAEWDTIKDTVSHYFDNPFFLSNFLFIKPSPDMTVEKKQKTKFYSVVCE